MGIPCTNAPTPKDPNSPVTKVILKIQAWLKKFVTVGFFGRNERGKTSDGNYLTRNFICDSHPALCLVCHRIRSLLIAHEIPNEIPINTRHGAYLWCRVKPRLLVDHRIRSYEDFKPTVINFPRKIIGKLHIEQLHQIGINATMRRDQ